MKFTYQARTKQGQLQSGTVEASSKEAALALLQKYGLFITFLEAKSEKPFYFRPIKIFETISRRDVVAFSRQLAILLMSKVPVAQSLSVLAYQTKNPRFKETILKIAEEVEGGTALSQALASYAQVFSPFYVAVIKSGEASGRLPESIEYLGSHLEKEYDFYSKIRGAMLYPGFILFVFSVVVLAMIFFVIPQLAQVLKETGQDLPFLTEKLLDLAEFLRKWGLVLISGLLLLISGLFQYYLTGKGKRFFDRFFLSLPGIGDFLKKLYLSYLAENLSTLIAGGLPITQALDTTAAIVGNDVYKQILADTQARVRKGESISSAFQRYPQAFPPLFVQMAVVGERAGKLDTALMNTGSFYRKEVDRALDNLTGLIEPVLIAFLGLMVGGLVIAILMPLYQIGI